MNRPRRGGPQPGIVRRDGDGDKEGHKRELIPRMGYERETSQQRNRGDTDGQPVFPHCGMVASALCIRPLQTHAEMETT